MAAEVYRIEIPITVRDRTEPAMTNARRKVSALERSLMLTQKRLTSWGQGLSSFGRSMTRYVTLPLVAAAAGALKLYGSFQQTFTRIGALVGTGGKQLEKFRAQVLDLSRRMPQGPQDLAEALYFITSSGFEGAKAMAVLRASAKAAAAGLGDTATVADAVTSAVNAYGPGALKASRATDILLATVREGKSEPTELAGAIGRVIAPAEAMGVSFARVGGALASLSLTGLDAAEAVTGLRGILTSLMNPTKMSKDALADLGYTVKGVQEAMAKDFVGTLSDLRGKLGDNKVAMGQLFGNVRALNAFLSLTGRNLEKNVGIFGKLERAIGDTDKAYDRSKKDPMFQFNKALSNLKATAIELAPAILPVAEKIMHLLEGWAKAISEMPEAKLERIVKLLGLAMVAGPAARLLGGGLRLAGAGVGAARWLKYGRSGASAGAGLAEGVAGGTAAGAGATGLSGTTIIGNALRMIGSSAAIAAFAPVAPAFLPKEAPWDAGKRDEQAAAWDRVDAMQAQMARQLLRGRLTASGAEARVGQRNQTLDQQIEGYGYNWIGNSNAPAGLQTEHSALTAGGAQDAFDLAGKAVEKQRDALATTGVQLSAYGRKLYDAKLDVDDFAGALGILREAQKEAGKQTIANQREVKRWGRTIEHAGKQALGGKDAVDGWATALGLVPPRKDVDLVTHTSQALRDVRTFYGFVNSQPDYKSFLIDIGYTGAVGGVLIDGEAPPGHPGKRRHDSGGSFTMRGPGSYAFNVGPIAEDVTFSPHGPGQKRGGRGGGGGGVNVQVAEGAVKITAGELNDQTVRRAASILADQIAADLEQHLGNR